RVCGEYLCIGTDLSNRTPPTEIYTLSLHDALPISREEALGARMSSLIIPERYRERHEQGLQRYLTTGEGPVLGQILEVEALRRDGEELPVELAISQAWREGRSTTFIAFIRDTTERRRDEETEQRRLGA